ncbi:MAG: TIGR04551 family protein [Polyangiaceae bacterium]|nr:TIGR04551 family protein [Polyangiaceae bacterium]
MRKLLSWLALGAVLSASSFAAAQAAPKQPAGKPAAKPPAAKGTAQPQAPPPPAPDASQTAPAQPAPTQGGTAQPAPGQPNPAQPPPTTGQTDGGAAGQGTQPPADNQPLIPTAKAANPDPDKDAKSLANQGAEKPKDDGAAKGKDEKSAPKPPVTGQIGARPGDVYAEDWWSHARPAFEFHGFFRVRSEFMDHFSLGRNDTPGKEMWPQPADNSYEDSQGARLVKLCGDKPADQENCENNTQAGANMRFRINPELHISDNLRVMAQIDMLDNLVLGSTPEGYSNQPATGSGYTVNARGGYAPLGAFSTTQWAPQAGVNSTKDSILVKRAWAEYMTPVGTLRFGRMPSHWGLGILANSGDGHDSDWQSTADRLMFVTGIKKYDVYFAAAWDFANEGAISSSLIEQQGQDYDLAQKDDVSQYVFAAVRRRNADLQKLELAKGQFVLNGGAYFVYRQQDLDNNSVEADTSASIGQSSLNVKNGYLRRKAEAFIPDLWVQFLYEKFRFEAEAVFLYGTIENTGRTPGAGTGDYQNSFDPTNPGWKIQQFGFAAEADYKALEDKLKVGVGFGYSSGDPDVEGLTPGRQGLQPQLSTDRTFSTFRFHPDYRVDLILFRNILTRVQGAYYLRPSVAYDFTREKNGQRIGGNAALIWSRASSFVQTPGNEPDLGVELNFGLYYQAKDGTLNDDPDKIGGFYTSLQYGVLFPLSGLGYYASQKGIAPDLQTAQMVRWYLGVMF